ncbi:acyl carrier protein [Colwelliaceae bacterium MEBiC 14330]
MKDITKNCAQGPLNLINESSIKVNTVAQVECYLNAWLDDNDYFEDEAINLNKSFAEIGLSSIDSVGLLEDIKNEFSVKIDPTAAWRFPNVNKLSRHIAELKVKQTQYQKIDKDIAEAVTFNLSKEQVPISTEKESNVADLALELEQLLYQQSSTIDQGEHRE